MLVGGLYRQRGAQRSGFMLQDHGLRTLGLQISDLRFLDEGLGFMD